MSRENADSDAVGLGLQPESLHFQPVLSDVTVSRQQVLNSKTSPACAVLKLSHWVLHRRVSAGKLKDEGGSISL